jgi:hypothetical protein
MNYYEVIHSDVSLFVMSDDGGVLCTALFWAFSVFFFFGCVGAKKKKTMLTGSLARRALG